MVETRSKSKTRPPTPKNTKKPTRAGATKVKNRISSPQARAARTISVKAIAQPSPLRTAGGYSSDEFNYEEEEEQEQSDKLHSDSSVVSSTSGSRIPLPWNLQQTLLQDIHSNGGIDKFRVTNKDSPQALSKLLDTRIDLYGKRGNSQRERIRKKVYTWKKIKSADPDKWYQILISFEILTATKAANKTEPDKPAEDERKPAAVAAEDERKPAAVANSSQDKRKPSATAIPSVIHTTSPEPETRESESEVSVINMGDNTDGMNPPSGDIGKSSLFSLICLVVFSLCL